MHQPHQRVCPSRSTLYYSNVSAERWSGSLLSTIRSPDGGRALHSAIDERSLGFRALYPEDEPHNISTPEQHTLHTQPASISSPSSPHHFTSSQVTASLGRPSRPHPDRRIRYGIGADGGHVRCWKGGGRREVKGEVVYGGRSRVQWESKNDYAFTRRYVGEYISSMVNRRQASIVVPSGGLARVTGYTLQMHPDKFHHSSPMH